AAQLRVYALRFHRRRVERRLGGETLLTLPTQIRGFLVPGRARCAPPSLGKLVEQRRGRFARIRLNADGDRVVAADVTTLDIDLHDRGVRLDRAIVEVAGELTEARADDEEHVGATTRGCGLRGAGPAERPDI